MKNRKLYTTTINFVFQEEQKTLIEEKDQNSVPYIFPVFSGCDFEKIMHEHQNSVESFPRKKINKWRLPFKMRVYIHTCYMYTNVKSNGN